MFGGGQGGSAAQQAEDPLRLALPQFPHNITACQPTPATAEGAPGCVPILRGIPRGEGCRHGLGTMSS